MRRATFMFTLGSVVLLGLMACGSPGSRVRRGDEENETINAETREALKLIAGKWQTDCMPFSNFGSQQIETHEFSAPNKWRYTKQLFSDRTCSTLELDHVMEGIFRVVEKPSENGERKVNLIVSAATAEPKSDALADSFNKEGECAHSDWKKDTLFDLIEKNCSLIQGDESDVIEVPYSGMQVFELIRLDGTTLYFGERSTLMRWYVVREQDRAQTAVSPYQKVQ